MNIHHPRAVERTLYTYFDDVKTLSKTFLETHNLAYFSHMRCFKNAISSHASTNPATTVYLLENGGPFLPPFLQSNDANAVKDKFYYLVQPSPRLKIMQPASAYFQLFQPIMIVYRHIDFYEIFTFSVSHQEPEQINYYLNHMADFEEFIKHYRENAVKILKDKSQQIEFPDHMYNGNAHLFLPEPLSKSPDLIVSKDDIGSTAKVSVNSSRASQGVSLIIDGVSVALTKREADCLRTLIQGNSAKETAEKFGISPRTIEGYLNSIKQKTFCRSKLELLSKISRAFNGRTLV